MIAVVAAEQFDEAPFAVLVEMVEGHGGHAAFVLLARAVHVEIAEARRLRGQAFLHAAAQYLVEQEFGIAVYVQRLFEGAFFTEHFAPAVHRRARRSLDRKSVV